jgi:hypothetical protein
MVNLAIAAVYFIRSWSVLHSQGVGHLYLAIASSLGFWWLIWVGILCFGGIVAFASPHSGAGIRRIAFTAIGVTVGYYAPQYLIGLFFFVAVWFRSLL